MISTKNQGDLIRIDRFVIYRWIFLLIAFAPKPPLQSAQIWNDPKACLVNKWPDLVKFCHFGKFFQVLGNFSKPYLVFCKILNLLRQFFMLFGHFSVAGNGHKLKNNKIIWSHCEWQTLAIFYSECDKN